MRLRNASLWVGVGPLAVLLLATLLFEWSSVDELNPASASVVGVATGDSPLLETRARIAWLTTVLLSVVVSLFTLVCCAGIVRRSLTLRQRRMAWLAALGLGVAGVLALLVSGARESALNLLVFESTFNALERSGRLEALFVGRVKFLISLVNVLAVVAPVGALVAFVATVTPPPEGKETIIDLRSRNRRLRETMNASAALLVTGILHMNTWLRWPAVFASDATARDGIEQFALAVSVFWGLTFSLMIMAAFLPATLLLRDRALRLQGEAPDAGADPEEWLAGHGFKLSMGEQLRQVAVILAPLFAGPAASLFGAFANWGQ